MEKDIELEKHLVTISTYLLRLLKNKKVGEYEKSETLKNTLRLVAPEKTVNISVSIKYSRYTG